ncbi:MAG: GNAT family N-acetyltransferase [Planctomycetaceae bacterium]|nr:GNAT family N-acetyltransferase [Planctomycetaceae bacterium]
MSQIVLRRMEKKDWNAVAELIYESTNAWYMKNRGFEIFTGPKDSTLLFCRTYEALDPGGTVIAEDTSNGKIAGSCFIHPRPTHISLGIMNVHPDYFGRQIAKRLLQHITDIADAEQKPVRLVSSAMNLDSFSLYNRAGFVPTIFFQDMTLKVPESGVSYSVPNRGIIRDAVQNDVAEIVTLEKELFHIEREKDFRYFIENRDGVWRMSVLVGTDGKINGYLASVADPGSNMLGPGIARTEAEATALLCAELNRHRGCQPVWLVPSQAKELVQAMYAIGAKNCELHVSQVRGNWQPPQGIVMPTFMPETC